MYDISAGEFNVCVREVYAKITKINKNLSSTRPEVFITERERFELSETLWNR